MRYDPIPLKKHPPDRSKGAICPLATSDSILTACANFMQLPVWHKHRLTILKPKFEGLPDGHCSKPDCLFGLAQLFYLVGDRAGSKLLLNHALKPWRERGDVLKVAQTLVGLSGTNELLGLRKEGI